MSCAKRLLNFQSLPYLYRWAIDGQQTVTTLCAFENGVNNRFSTDGDGAKAPF